jgi:transposase
MPRNSEITPETRAQIVALSTSGMRQVDIGKQLKVSKQVVSATVRRCNGSGSFKSAQRSGRPKVTTSRDDNVIRRLAVRHPTWSSATINAELPTPISNRTVRRRLHDTFALKARVPAKKPLLSKKNIKDRIAFCRKYREWTPEQWQGVLFSDESAFYQFQNYQKYIRRPANCRFNIRYTIPTVKHSTSVMVWGSMSATGPGDLWFMPKNTTINSQVYLRLLQEKLPPLMERLNCHTFQHDGAPCHQAKIVKQWLQTSQIPVLDWPGQSPDLNPIENAWFMIKKRVASRKPTSLEHLKNIIKEVWEESFSSAECQILVETMPERIRAVMKNQGAHCKY